ncbi:MAG: SixA phosphatase family protein [Methylococcales bacterium]
MSKASKRLILLRHAKSSWESDADNDFDRPLAKRGKQDAIKAGLWLKHQKLIPDLILSSPANRARKTILKACAGFAFNTDDIRWTPEIYDASLNDLLKILKNCSDDAKSVMLVGHNPGMEYLLEYLSRDRIPLASDGKLLTAGCIANLEITTKWALASRSCAKVLAIIRPAEMK